MEPFLVRRLEAQLSGSDKFFLKMVKSFKPEELKPGKCQECGDHEFGVLKNSEICPTCSFTNEVVKKLLGKF